ncbi:MAG: hypothetical protein K0Q90_4325 [Paenibacillaceae bacterium]|jgi:hypothetical protein|nr:hypothetical protein [Paenibacillaceae bacterium]
MEFLSTLAGNLPFLIVVLAGLFSLFKKFNGPGSPQQEKPKQPRSLSPMPTFGGGQGGAKKPARKAEANPWEADHELKRRQEEIEREQEAWRREERAETERSKIRQEEEEADSQGAAGWSEPKRSGTAAAVQRGSPFPAPGTGRTAVFGLAARDGELNIGGRESAAHTDGGWKPEGEDLARAVVWSEILGPPRSKRPHRR